MTSSNNQRELIDWVNDPANIKKAVEGSMEKRQAVLDSHNPTLDARLDSIISNVSFVSQIATNRLANGEYGYEEYRARYDAAIEQGKSEVKALIVDELEALHALAVLAKANGTPQDISPELIEELIAAIKKGANDARD